MLKEISQKIGKNILLISITIICIVLCCTLYFFYQRNTVTKPASFQRTSSSEQEQADDKQTSEKIVIYITGEVNKPGVYELDKGSRIIDALRMAEGAAVGADLDSINLASLLNDAQHVVIPAISGNELSNSAETEGTGNRSNNTVETERNGLININTADKSKLATLPGIGDVIAEYIVNYREENGGFKSLDEIKDVPRIGEKTYEKIKDRIYID